MARQLRWIRDHFATAWNGYPAADQRQVAGAITEGETVTRVHVVANWGIWDNSSDLVGIQHFTRPIHWGVYMHLTGQATPLVTPLGSPSSSVWMWLDAAPCTLTYEALGSPGQTYTHYQGGYQSIRAQRRNLSILDQGIYIVWERSIAEVPNSAFYDIYVSVGVLQAP